MKKNFKHFIAASLAIILSYSFIGTYVCNELGGLKNCKDENYYECVILVNENSTKDSDIEKLIEELPKFNRYN